MPPLRHPDTPFSISLPPRAAQLAAETGVLVVGGGPAGLGAALGAANAGADVILAERYGFLGGNARAALVMPLLSFHTQTPRHDKPGKATLLPTDHGPGKQVVAGVLTSLLDRLSKANGAIAPSLQSGYVVPLHPELSDLSA